MRWSAEDDQLLGQLYADQLTIEKIAVRVGRSADAVVARRRTLGIAARPRSRPWSGHEEAFLRAATLAGIPAPSVGARLGRSTDQVRARRRRLVPPRPSPRPYFSDEDAEITRCLQSGGNLADVAARIGRSVDAVRLHAQQLGVYDPLPRRRWSEWEDAVLRDGYTSALPCAAIAEHLTARTEAAIAARARRLALAVYARRWSTRDERLLTHLARVGTSLEAAAQQLGRTPEATRRRARRLGVASPRPAYAARHRRRWAPDEDELLRLQRDLNPARLAQLLGRSDGAVCRRLRILGLRREAKRSPHHSSPRVNGTVHG